MPDGSASTGYKTTTGFAVGANAVSFALNAVPPGESRSLTGALAIATGVLGVAAGAPNLDESGSRRTLGFVNAGVGAASALLGVYRLARRPRTESLASVGPWVDARGVPGVSVSFSF